MPKTRPPAAIARPDSGDEAAVSLAEIAAHPFLAGMKRKHLRLIALNAMRISFAVDHQIFREGDLANRFYLVETGRVALEAEAGDTGRALIQTVGLGEVLGWSWLFPPYYWHFSARVLAPTRAIFLYGTRLRNQCEEDHDFGYELIKRMAAVTVRRMQAARERLLQHYRQADPSL